MDDHFPGIRMASMGQTAERLRETPNAANEVQYPEEFNSSVPVITAAPLQKSKTETIIIALQSKGYPEEAFKADVAKTLDYFEIEPDSHYLYQAILLKPVSKDLKVLDSADATSKLKKVVDMMNRNTVVYMDKKERHATAELPTGNTKHDCVKEEVIITTSSTYQLRIVSLGVTTSNFIFDALQYIVNHWNVPNKYVQFVTNEEIGQGKLLDFGPVLALVN